MTTTYDFISEKLKLIKTFFSKYFEVPKRRILKTKNLENNIS